MKIPLYQIDAFTNQLFAGNPAAVCPLENWPDDNTLLSIAAENNLSETAFFVKQKNQYLLRWFTPKVEVDLCGHATLASAYVIFNYLNPALDLIRFETKSGQLIVRREGKFLSMDFPARKPKPCEAPHDLLTALNEEPSAVLLARDYLVVYDSQKTVRSIQPNFDLLSKLNALGIIITAPGDTVDFVSRFFAPKAGINEDPVTGSAHSTLIPYWSDKLNKIKMHAFQVSDRGGELFCENLGDRVKISGQAVKYLEGFVEI